MSWASFIFLRGPCSVNEMQKNCNKLFFHQRRRNGFLRLHISWMFCGGKRNKKLTRTSDWEECGEVFVETLNSLNKFLDKRISRSSLSFFMTNLARRRLPFDCFCLPGWGLRKFTNKNFSICHVIDFSYCIIIATTKNPARSVQQFRFLLITFNVVCWS